VTVLSASLSVVALVAALAAPQAPAPAGPETFDLVATASATGAAKGGVTVTMTLQLQRFTPEPDRVKMTDALKYSGYPGFLNALRDTPQVGTLDVAGQVFIVRWAREVPTAAGREISIVTDQPVFFIGSGRRGAKPTAGYEVAVIRLVLDRTGKGDGTMAAAARVKPGGETGVRIDRYEATPLMLIATPHAAK